MKHRLSFLFALLVWSSLVLAQQNQSTSPVNFTRDSTLLPPKNRYTLSFPDGKTGILTDGDGNKNLLFPSANKTLAEVRSINSILLGQLPQIITLTDPGRGGVFYLDLADTTTPDNGATVLRTSTNFCYKRQYYGKVFVGWFGAKANKVTDDQPAIQAAMDYCRQQGQDIDLGSGQYLIMNPLSLTLNNGTGALIHGGRRTSLTGSAFGSACLIYGGPSNQTALSIYGSYDDQLTLGDFNIVQRNQSQQGIGLYIDRLVNFNIRRMKVSYFQTGVRALNINEGSIEDIICDWNVRGFYATTNGEVLPNVIHFNACAFNSNSEFGAFIEAGCSNVLTACRFLGNGTDNTGGGLRISYGGYNGRNIVTLNGGYFENNSNHSIDVTCSDGGSMSLNGVTFNKTNNGHFATNHLYVSPLNLVNNDGKIIKIVLSGNATYTTGNYVPSTSRKDVVLSPGANGYNGYDVTDNSYYQSDLERPVYIGQRGANFDTNGELNLYNSSTPIVYINNVSGTLKKISNGPQIGNRVVIQADNPIMIEHNAGIILRGGRSMTMVPGGTLTLIRQSEGQYREESRQQAAPIDANATANFSGQILLARNGQFVNSYLSHLTGGSSVPVLTTQAAAGSGATASLTDNTESSTDMGGLISLRTGSTPPGGTVLHVTFATAYDRIPKVLLDGANDAAISSRSLYRVDNRTPAGFDIVTVGSATLPASTTLLITYIVLE